MEDMNLEYNQLNTLSEQYGSSFYLFYPERFVENLKCLSEGLVSYYPKSRLAYAYKANYMPILGDYLNQNGCWGEVVSGMEYDIARLCLPGERLIFNGPCKSVDDINKAIKEGSIVNLDSFYELDLLKSVVELHQQVSIGLRVNFDIGTGKSRFGFNVENGDFMKAVNELQSLCNVSLVSLHSHFTTKQRSLELFERRVNGMIDVFESVPEKDKIAYMNIGGGFFGPISEAAKKNFSNSPPTFEEYASLIGKAFFNHFGNDGPYLFVEPGISMIANAMDFVVKALDMRDSNGRDLLTVDGSVNNLYPTGSKYTPDYSVVSQKDRKPMTCDIVGYTCMEHDVLMESVDITARPGDYIVFHNRGAYSNVYKPPFIKSAPPIIGRDGQVFSRRQTYEDVISTYSLSV